MLDLKSLDNQEERDLSVSQAILEGRRIGYSQCPMWSRFFIKDRPIGHKGYCVGLDNIGFIVMVY